MQTTNKISKANHLSPFLLGKPFRFIEVLFVRIIRKSMNKNYDKLPIELYEHRANNMCVICLCSDIQQESKSNETPRFER